MSGNAIRALVLLANLVLLGLIGWVCYDTFVALDETRWDIEPPQLEKYVVPDRPVDESQQRRDLYKSITRALDRPPPPREVVAPPVTTVAPKLPDPKEIKVIAISYAPDPTLASAWLAAPLSSVPDGRFFRTGMDLGQPGFGFEAYKDCKLKEITQDAVVIVDQKGQEVRLAGPRARPGGGS